MIIDQQTLSIATGLVVLTAGTVFVLETLFRRDSTVSRVWSLAYLGGILTSFSYVLWATDAGSWWAVAVGNGAFVLSAGAIWSGCRAFNGRSSRIWVVGVASAVTAAAVAVEGPDGGDWAGAYVWLLGVGAFAGLGAIETFTGPMHKDTSSRGLACVLGLESVFFLARLVVLVFWGSDNVVFSTLLGTASASALTIVLMIVAVVTMSVMRAETAPRGSSRSGPARVFSRRGLIDRVTFEQVVTDRLERSEIHGETVTLLHLNLDDLEEINTAFGRSAADLVLTEYAATVRRQVPVAAVVGDVGVGRIAVAAPATTPGEAIVLATALRRALLDVTVPEAPGAKLTASIGAATTDHQGYDTTSMSDAARAASEEASREGGNRVVSASLLGWSSTAETL